MSEDKFVSECERPVRPCRNTVLWEETMISPFTFPHVFVASQVVSLKLGNILLLRVMKHMSE